MNTAPTPQRVSDVVAGQAVGAAVQALARAFAATGIASPHLDARLLVQAATGWDAAALLAHPDRTLAPDAAARITMFAQARLQREPVSRILGARSFYGYMFNIAPCVLDPRPDSELLVTLALARLTPAQLQDAPFGDAPPPSPNQASSSNKPSSPTQASGAPRILDIGTGSGCLLLSILAACPKAHGVGTDVSDEALSVARTNAARLAVSARAMFVRTDGASGLNGPFDVLVSNPPYIPTSTIDTLDDEVRRYDPHLALDGGANGLDLYPRLIAQALALVPAGLILFEVGAGQADDLRALAQREVRARQTAGLAVEPAVSISVHRDINGVARVVAIDTQRQG
ncbi:MAG: peptide chain release factor N(5)-glutamine methyltransferase [Pseudomonadota bacterium]